MSRLADIYRRTKKPHDIVWNRFVARPLAAALLVPLEHGRVTPNQLTLLTLVVFAASAAVMALAPGHAGLLAAVAILEASYVLDCADGQLARLRGTSTPVGAHLDYVTDELKAFLLVAGASLRLWRTRGRPHPAFAWLGHHEHVLWLVEGVLALCAVASAISLTTFMRRPEFVAAAGRVVSAGTGDYGEGFAAPPPRRSFSPGALVMAAGRLIVHYPSYIWLLAVVDRLDVFLHAYFLANAAYAARSFLGVARTLGRSAPPAAGPEVKGAP